MYSYAVHVNMAFDFDSDSGSDEYGNFLLTMDEVDTTKLTPQFEWNDAELAAFLDEYEHVTDIEWSQPATSENTSELCDSTSSNQASHIRGATASSDRFPNFDEEELKQIEDNALSKGTKQQTAWGVKLFRQWLGEAGHDVKFEQMDVGRLNTVLRLFYASVRNTNGSLYSKSTFVGIRAAINRFLRAPPHNKSFSILNDAEFHHANNMFKAMLKKLKKEGMDTTKHHQPISEADLEKLRSCGVFDVHHPKSLQRKVWFDIMLAFARRGRENLRNLTATAFIFKSDESGKEFVEMAYNESTKNHAGDDLKDTDFEAKPRMYATVDSRCPLASLKKYLSKRNPENDIFFQQPKSLVFQSDEVWYTSRPVGQRTLNDMMKMLSKDAGLGNSYTNHCVRATTITMLSHAGVEAREIMRISGHKNEASIRSYNSDSSDAQKRHYSSIIQGDCSSPLPAQEPSPLPVPAQPNGLHHRTALEPLPISTQFNSETNINHTVYFPTRVPYTKQFEVHNSTVNVYNYYGN